MVIYDDESALMMNNSSNFDDHMIMKLYKVIDDNRPMQCLPYRKFTLVKNIAGILRILKNDSHDSWQ